MKLQDAYVSESNEVGTWKLIGYKGPGDPDDTSKEKSVSTNFTYSNPDISDKKSVTGLSGKVGWQAVNNVTLNDCGANSCTWKLTLSKGDNGNGVEYAPDNPAADLTPSFDKIGTSK